MRVNENFFDSDKMKILEAMPDGYLYSNILMKLYLKSLRTDGKLMFNERIPYNTEMLAVVTGHKVGVVEKSMKIFKQMDLIEVLDTGEIYMLDIQNYIGKTSTEADRIKKYRKEIEDKKQIECTKGVQMYNKCTPKIEIEKEIELKKETLTNVSVKKDTEREEWFNAFWTAYPNKASKKKSRERFLQICTSQSKFDTIMQGMQKTVIAKANAEGSTQYIPMATTWLNGERWNDEPYQPKTTNNYYQRAQTMPSYMNETSATKQEKASAEDLASIEEQMKSMAKGGGCNAN